MYRSHFKPMAASWILAGVLAGSISLPAGGQEAKTSQTPHGGKVTAAWSFQFEVVFESRKTSVYLYDSAGQPVSARGATGEVVMQVRGNPKQFRYALQYVGQTPGTSGQDHLALVIDLSKIRDGDMQVTFNLANLPSRQHPSARFVQTFALSRPALRVTTAQYTSADKSAAIAQKVCPVSGGRLDSMGTPIKLLVGNEAIYLCCKGCVTKVKNNPEKYLLAAKGQAPLKTRPAASNANLSITYATQADTAALNAQRVCVISGERLGSMGTPIKVSQGGKAIFLCCKGCIGTVKKNFNRYFPAAGNITNDGATSGSKVSVTKATQADQAAVRDQKVCVVSGERLGSMGTPIKVSLGDKAIYVCCKGCVGTVKKNPQQYLAKATQLRSQR